MTRLIDADALDVLTVIGGRMDGKVEFAKAVNEMIQNAPTIDAVPTEFVMEIGCLEFVCDELTDDGEWCSERCQYSEPQPECIHRYIDRIWRKEHAETD